MIARAVGAQAERALGLPVSRIADAVIWAVRLLAQDTFLPLLVTLTFISGVFWAALIPLWQTPDEPAHYGYIQTLGEDFSLLPDPYLSQEIRIVQDVTGLGLVPFHGELTQPFAIDSREGPQEDQVRALPQSARVEKAEKDNPADSYPPGYYLGASVVYRLLRNQDIFTVMFSLRVLSAFITALTMLFNYLTLKRFFRDEASAKATALIIAFSPMYVFMGMAVNADTLVWLLFSVYLYLMTRAFDDGLSPTLNLLIALTAALGLWVKQTFLLAIPFYFILIAFLLLRRSLTLRQSLMPVLVFLGTIAVLDGWLYLGDFIRTSPVADADRRESEEASLLGFFQHFEEHWTFYRWTFDSFWGNFGWLDAPLSQRSYDYLRWTSAAAAGLLAIYLIASAALRRVDTMSLFFLALAVTFVLSFAGINYLKISAGEGWTIQGRYFFPIIAVIIGLQVKGLTAFLRPKPLQNLALLALVVGIVLFQVDALARYIIPRYYL